MGAVSAGWIASVAIGAAGLPLTTAAVVTIVAAGALGLVTGAELGASEDNTFYAAFKGCVIGVVSGITVTIFALPAISYFNQIRMVSGGPPPVSVTQPSGSPVGARPNPGSQFPVGAPTGRTIPNIDPNSLQAGRGDLMTGRLARQQQLIEQGTPRITPIKVTPEGVIWDGNHGARAAAEAGVPVSVEVVPGPLLPKGPIIRLPVRP